MYVAHFDKFLNLFSIGLLVLGPVSGFCKLNRKVETKVSKGLNNVDDIFILKPLQSLIFRLSPYCYNNLLHLR